MLFLPTQKFPDLIKHVQMADCVVVPSLTEGFGYAVLEASTAGTAVVASDCTSIPEVACGRCVLVQPKDPSAIATGVARVAKGNVGSTAMKRFPWSRTIDEYEQAYYSTLEAKRKKENTKRNTNTKRNITTKKNTTTKRNA